MAEQIEVSKLNEWDKNPRAITDEAFERLKHSIKRNPEFLEKRPLLAVEKDGRLVVYAGNQRLKAVRALGWEKVPVEVDKGLTEAKMVEQAMIDNAQWGQLVIEKAKALDLGDDFLKLIGINVDLFSDITEDSFDADKYVSGITVPQTKEGDLYELGDHRLLCADATIASSFDKLLGEEKARLIFTDPPYNVNYRSPGGLDYNSTKFGGTGSKIFNDNKSNEDCLQFYTDVLKNLYLYSTDDCTIYWWFANKNNSLNRVAFDNSGWHMGQIVIWLKNSMVFSRGQDYHRQYEPCMLGWKTKKSHYRNKKIANLKDVFNLDFEDYQNMLDVWYQTRDITTQYIHPTQKPVRLGERAYKKNSEVGDIVIDVFGGSGSTLIGCHQKGRKTRLMELDPKYCDAIIERFCQFTGNNKIIKNGKEFIWQKKSEDQQ